MRWTTACTLLKIAETREPSYQPHVDQPRLHGEVVEQGGGRWPGRSPPPIGRTYLVGDGGVVVINCRLIWVAMSKFKLTTHQWGLGCAAEPWRPITKKKNPTLVSAISSRPFPTCPDELSPHRTNENRQNRFSTDDSCTRVAYARCRGNCVSCINPESRGAAKVIPVSLGAAGGRPSCARLATEHAGGGERRSRDASSPLDSRPDAAFDCIRRPVSFASICCCMVQRTFKARSPAH